MMLVLFFVSGDGGRSRFLAAIVSSCSSPSAVMTAEDSESIGTSISRTADFPDWFDIEILDTGSELVGVFGRLFPVYGRLTRCGFLIGSWFFGWVCIRVGFSFPGDVVLLRFLVGCGLSLLYAPFPNLMIGFYLFRSRRVLCLF